MIGKVLIDMTMPDHIRGLRLSYTRSTTAMLLGPASVLAESAVTAGRLGLSSIVSTANCRHGNVLHVVRGGTKMKTNTLHAM